MSAEQSIQHRATHKGVDRGFGFDDAGELVPITDFVCDENSVKQRDYEAAIEFYRDHAKDLARAAVATILAGNPSPEIAGRRAYFLAFTMGYLPIKSQAELVELLNLSKGAVSQQLNQFLSDNPLIPRPNCQKTT